MDGINWNTWLQIFGLTVVNIGTWVFVASSGIPAFISLAIGNAVGLLLIKIGIMNEIEGRYR